MRLSPSRECRGSGRRSRAEGVRGCLFWGLLLLAACEDSLRIPDAQSSYVDLYLDEGISVCDGQLTAYDRFFENAFRLWTDSSPPADFRASVHALLEPPCSTHSCAQDDNAYLAGDLGQYHELAHVMHLFLDGRSTESLEEGTATALGPLAHVAFRADGLAQVDRGFLFAPNLTATEYGYAGAFTRFLVERHGVSTYRDFFVSLDQASDDAAFRTEFERVFSEGLPDAWASFSSGPGCTYDYWFCDGAAEVELPFEQQGLDCSSDAVLGFEASASAGVGSEGFRRFRVLRFENPVTRVLTFEMQSARLYVGRCGDCDAQMPGLNLSSVDEPGVPPTSVDVELEPGPYSVIVRSKPEGDAWVSIQ